MPTSSTMLLPHQTPCDDGPLCCGDEWGHQASLQEVGIWVVFKSRQTPCSMLTKVKDTLPIVKQSNVVYHIPYSCGQIYIGETKLRQTEGTPRCLWERDGGEVGCGRAYVGEPPPHQLGGDISAGQGTTCTTEGGLAHPDDTCRGALQQGQRTGDPRLLVPLVRRQEGRAAGSRWPLTSNDIHWRLSSVVYSYKMLVFS